MNDEISRPRKIQSAANVAAPAATITSSMSIRRIRLRIYTVCAFKLHVSQYFSIYSLEINPLRCATSFHGASTASAGSCNISSPRAFIARIARRSRRAVNQSGGRISKSLGMNSSVTSAAKISTQGLPQTDCANALLSDCNSRSMCRASEVLRPQYLASANPVFFRCAASSFLKRSA